MGTAKVARRPLSRRDTHVIRLAGHRLKVTHTDGNPLVQPVEVDAIPIAPSERYDVLFVADRAGAWFLSCAEAGHPGAGAGCRRVRRA